MGKGGPSHPSKGPTGLRRPRARLPRLPANIAPAARRASPTRSADVYIRAAYARVILMPVGIGLLA